MVNTIFLFTSKTEKKKDTQIDGSRTDVGYLTTTTTASRIAYTFFALKHYWLYILERLRTFHVELNVPEMIQIFIVMRDDEKLKKRNENLNTYVTNGSRYKKSSS